MQAVAPQSGDDVVSAQVPDPRAVSPQVDDPEVDLGRAIRPTTFDVYADPTIIMPIVLANLLSETLWSTALTLRTASIGAPLVERVVAMQRHLNRWLEHLTPEQVVERDGVLDLDIERARLGAPVVDAALDRLRHTIAHRTARGTLPPQDPLLRMIEQNQFPAYIYGTIEELVAHRRHLGLRRGHTHGLSSCLDEAALFSSFLLTQPVDDIDGAVILGSAGHYTVLVWSGQPDHDDFQAAWFYGKNVIITLEEYAHLLDEQYHGDIHLAFDDRLPDLELILSRRGTWFLSTRETSIPADEEARITSVLTRFFGGPLAAVAESLSAPLQRQAPSDFDDLVEKCVDARGRAAIEGIVAGQQTMAARQVLASSRDVERLGLDAFSKAAYRGSRLHETRERLAMSGSDLSEVLVLDSPTSPFAQPGMLAMPEEVLRYRCGTERDRELLRAALTR